MCAKPDSSVEDWNRTFINTKKLISEACLDRELILGRPFLIQYVDSSLLIYDDIGDSLFLLVDLKENDRVYRFGQKGEGNNEFLQVFAFCNMKSDSILGVYDAYKHELREINLDKVKRGEMNFPVVFKDTLSSIKLSPTKYDAYLGLGFYESNMLSLTDNSIGSKFFLNILIKIVARKLFQIVCEGWLIKGLCALIGHWTNSCMLCVVLLSLCCFL